MSVRSFALLFILALASAARADGAKKLPPTPEARARALLEKQVKALPEDNAALIATFAKDAVVLLPYGSTRVDVPDLVLGAAITGLHPHAALTSAKIGQLTAGGNAAMVWLAAELAITLSDAVPGEAPSSEAHTVRVLELLDAGSDWKVVAASFAEVRPLEQRPSSFAAIASSTLPGPLTPLLASPDKLAAAFAGDPRVLFGTDPAERAIGTSAVKALLTKWGKLPLRIDEADKVREVRTASWGYAMANVSLAKAGGPPYRMTGFLIAVPAANGAWSVVAVVYGAQ